MSPRCLLILGCVLLAACDNFRGKNKYHTAAITAPSVGEVKASIGQAQAASQETSRHISAIKAGTSRVDYKASRALDYFP